MEIELAIVKEQLYESPGTKKRGIEGDVQQEKKRRLKPRVVTWIFESVGPERERPVNWHRPGEILDRAPQRLKCGGDTEFWCVVCGV